MTSLHQLMAILNQLTPADDQLESANGHFKTINNHLKPGAREQGVLRVLQHPLFFLWATVNCCE